MVTAADFNAEKNKTAALEAKVTKLEALTSRLFDRITKLEEENATKDKKISDLEKNQTSVTANSSAEFWNNLPKQASIGISNVIATEKKSVAKKEKNIIIFGIPPQNGTDGDKSALKKIFDKIEPTANTETIKLIRFEGKNGKHGPILVELESVTIKNQVLKSARKLREINEYKNVYINPDLTESEAALEKSIRSERDKKNEELHNVSGNGLRYGMHKFKDGTTESKSKNFRVRTSECDPG